MYIAIAVVLSALFPNLTSSREARAQTTPPSVPAFVQMDVQAAYEGNFKYGEWLPIYVELKNNGADIQGVLHAPIQTSEGTIFYSQAVELPAGAHKRIALYIQPNNFSRTTVVEFVKENELLASSRVSLRPNPNINYVAGLVMPERGAVSLINTIELPGQKRTIVSVDISLAQLPERFEGLRSLDLIILSNTDTSKLSPDQGQALLSWVRQGGRLVVGGGTSAVLTVAGLPEDLFPAKIKESVVLDTAIGLETFVGAENPIRVPGPFIGAILETNSGAALATQNNISIVHEWSLQNGFVDFIALDPAATPFDAWNGTVRFWQKLISPGSAFPQDAPPDVSARQQFASSIPYALSNLPMLDLPSVTGLAIMLFVYILIVGPVNYYVLRRSKKLQWAWITIPVITFVFAAASFGLGYAMHGTNIFINKIAVIQVDQGGNAYYDSFIGVFSPAPTSYRVQVDGDDLLSPLGQNYDPWSSSQPSAFTPGKSMAIFQGSPAIIEGLSVEQWSMQSVMSEGFLSDFGNISASIQVKTDTLEGHIKNGTREDFDDAYLVFGNRSAALGSLPAGTGAEFSLDLTGLGSPNYSSSLSYSMFQTHLETGSINPDYRKYESKRSLIENIFERTPPYVLFSSTNTGKTGQNPVFVGFITKAPPEVKIISAEAAQQATGVVLQPLQLSLPKEGDVRIPPGMIPGKVTTFPADGWICGMPWDTAVYIARGEAETTFFIPQELIGVEISALRLGIWNDSGDLLIPELDLFDYSRHNWVMLEGMAYGVNQIPNASPFVDPMGQVKIRLRPNQNQECIYLTLGLEGVQR